MMDLMHLLNSYYNGRGRSGREVLAAFLYSEKTLMGQIPSCKNEKY